MRARDAAVPGVKDIAKATGVAIGTVDRALHGRNGVSAATKARVLQAAAELGYKPNVAARSLKLNRRVRIAVHLPTHIASFFTPLLQGIEAAADAVLGAAIELDVRRYPRLNEGDAELLEAIKPGQYDGVLFTPGNPARLAGSIRRLAREGTAMFCVASDAPETERVGSVVVDARVSGAMAAELLSVVLPHEGSVATITGELRTLDHLEKLSGFATGLAMMAPHLRLLPVVESHESSEEAYRRTSDVLRDHPELGGIYISTANSLPVLQALGEHNLLGRVKIVATDLFTTLADMIDGERVFATLYQRPFTQGKMAFERLAALILSQPVPQRVTRIAPHVIFRSNLPLFAARAAHADLNRLEAFSTETVSAIDAGLR